MSPIDVKNASAVLICARETPGLSEEQAAKRAHQDPGGAPQRRESSRDSPSTSSELNFVAWADVPTLSEQTLGVLGGPRSQVARPPSGLWNRSRRMTE
jgi:hypothetical protein